MRLRMLARNGLLLALAIAVGVGRDAAALELHVARGGSDASAGDAANPWATLQHAVDLAAPGDTIVLGLGDFAGARITRSGSPGQPITIRGMGSDNTSVRTFGALNTTALLELEGVTDWAFEDMHVGFSPAACMQMQDCRRVALRRLMMGSADGAGVLAVSSHELQLDGILMQIQRAAIGARFIGGCDDVSIRRCRFLDNRHGAILVSGAGGGAADLLSERIAIESNSFDRCWAEAADSGVVELDGVHDAMFRNNAVHGCEGNAVAVLSRAGSAPCGSVAIVHDSIQLSSAVPGWAVLVADASAVSPPTGVLVQNNILTSDHPTLGSIAVHGASAVLSDNNVLDDRLSLDEGRSMIGLAQWSASSGQDGRSRLSTPQLEYVSPASDLFRLRGDGEAVDLGIPGLADVDRNGVARPLGAAPDAGCDELGPPLADFTASPVVGIAPLAVQFTDATVGEPTAWEWDFDHDGTVDDRSAAPATHVYEQPGHYSASLRVTNRIGSDERVRQQLVCVAPSLRIVEGLRVQAVSPSLRWSPLQAAGTYDVVRGDLARLIATRGDFSAAVTECIEAADGDLVADDRAPGTPAVFWLVSGTACGLQGSWDSSSPALLASRDAGVRASSAACP